MGITSKKIQYKSKEQASFHAWAVVITSSLFFFYIFIQMNMFSAINPELTKEFHFTSKQISQLFAYYSYGNVLFLFPAGILLDRFSVRNLLLTVFTISIICTYIFSTSSSICMMNISRLVIGLAGSFAMLSAVKLASRWFNPKHMALVVGIVVTIAMFGGTIAQAPLTMLTEKLGWRGAMQLVALFGILLVIAQFAIVRDEPKELQKLDVKEHKQLEKFGFWHSLGITVTNSQNWLSGVYVCLLNFPLFVFGGIWGVPYLTQIHNLTRMQATAVTTMIFIGMMIGAPLAGLISDRLGLRKLPMIVGALLSILVMLAIMFAPTMPFFGEICLYLVFGLVISSQVIGYPVVAESNPHAITATATSLASTLIMSGGMMVPIFGWLLGLHTHTATSEIVKYSLTDFTRANYLLLAGLAVALIASLLIKETYCKQINEIA